MKFKYTINNTNGYDSDQEKNVMVFGTLSYPKGRARVDIETVFIATRQIAEDIVTKAIQAAVEEAEQKVREWVAMYEENPT